MIINNKLVKLFYLNIKLEFHKKKL